MAEKKRPPKPILPKLIGSATAFTALAVAVLLGFDVFDTIFRAMLAYMAGHFCGAVWEALFGRRESEIETVSVSYEVQQPVESRPEIDPNMNTNAEDEAA